jgi:CBS domain-containing protein
MMTGANGLGTTWASPNDLFATTMARLEEAFQVRHIATFDLITCDVQERAAEILQTHADFDQVPVTRDGSVVGVLVREEGIAAQIRAEDVMRPLDLSFVVSAYEPLSKLLPMLEGSAYRLVSVGGEVKGIITRSDVLKLPVRLLTFGMITHLELLMAAAIRARCNTKQEWLATLSADRVERVEKKEEELRTGSANPDLLELTDFADKRVIVRALYGLNNRFETELGAIERVRNKVAHAADYASDLDTLKKFVKRIELVDKWIRELTRLVYEKEPSSAESLKASDGHQPSSAGEIPSPLTDNINAQGARGVV